MARGNGNCKAKVIEYFMKHPGEVLFLQDISGHVGYETRQVQSSISHMLRADSLPGLHPMVRGNSWKYVPEANGKKIFEELATTKTGDLIIQDADGNVWRATPLD